MSILRFGTCSWKFPSWAGLVYSQPHRIDYLAEYARVYRSVEIDQWFWSLFAPDRIALPQTETVAGYLASVDEDFRFTIKAPNSVTLTHFSGRAGQKGRGPNPYFLSVELFVDFLERIAPMRPRTAAVMLQFEYLNKQKMSGLEEFCEKIDVFLTALRDRVDPWPIGIELRNPNFLESAYFDLLAAHRVPHVYCHGYYLPPAPGVYRRASAQLGDRLPGPGVLRLLGPDRSGIEKTTGKKWNAIVAPKDDELPAIADTTIDMLARGLDVYVNVNNHYEGSAPLTIEKLERLVDERRERFSQIR
ncbi:MAG: DUF72 domain-containing protein [Spirochaetota bacterium]